MAIADSIIRRVPGDDYRTYRLCDLALIDLQIMGVSDLYSAAPIVCCVATPNEAIFDNAGHSGTFEVDVDT